MLSTTEFQQACFEDKQPNLPIMESASWLAKFFGGTQIVSLAQHPNS
ncbi:MAG: hypothetical protein VXZ82_22295 [Planctomycetota bacterium]|nr:hypothetical protein [Planctomycetota bacterium]